MSSTLQLGNPHRRYSEPSQGPGFLSPRYDPLSPLQVGVSGDFCPKPAEPVYATWFVVVVAVL